jgi:Flp pilus assembly protein CpaB
LISKIMALSAVEAAAEDTVNLLTAILAAVAAVLAAVLVVDIWLRPPMEAVAEIEHPLVKAATVRVQAQDQEALRVAVERLGVAAVAAARRM